ncbi:hypothetical protein Efla_001711 [Eimeria flavescens]
MSYDRRSEPRRSHSGGRANYGRHRGGRADQKSPDLRNQGSLDHRHRTYRNGTPEYGDRYRRRSPSGARQGREPRAYRYGRNGPYRRSRTRSPERKRSRSLEPYPRSERFTQRDAPSARFGSRASYLRSRGTCRGASRSPSRSGRRQSPILRGQDGRRDAGSPSSSRSRYRERREDYRERDRRQSPPDRQFYRSGRSPNRNERSAYRGRNTRQSFSPAKRGIEDRFGDRRQAERGQYRRKPSSEPREQRRSPRGRRSPERRQSSAFPRSVSRSFSGSTKRIAAAASGRTASAVHTPRGGSCSTAKDKKSPSGDAHSPGHPSSGRQWSYRDSGQKSDGASTRRSVELDRRSRRLSSSGSRGKADATPSRRSPLHTKAPVRSHGGSRERAENEGARRSQQREEELTRRSGEREDDRCRRSEQREDEGSRGEQRDDEHKERFAQLGDERGRGSLQREDSPSRGSMLRKNGPCRRSEQREDGHSRRSGQREDGHSRHSEQREDGPSRHSQQRENGRSRPSDQREKPRRVVSPRQSADCPTPDLTLTRSSGAEGERRRAADGDRKPSLASDECEPLSVEEGAQERHLSAESESRRESATGLAGIQEQSASSPDGKELSNIGAGAKARKCESSPPSPSVLRMEAEDKDHKERSPSRISTKAAPETALPKSAAGEVEEPTELAAVHSGRDLGSCSVSSAPFQHQGGTPRMEEDAVLTKSKRVHSSSLRSPETRRRTASLRGSPRPRGEDNPESDEIADARPDNNRSMSGARSSSSAPIRSVDPEGTIEGGIPYTIASVGYNQVSQIDGVIWRTMNGLIIGIVNMAAAQAARLGYYPDEEGRRVNMLLVRIR